LFSQDPLGLVVAHRGLATSEAENTLEAFAAALDVGADAVEFDVRLTGDGVPIVMHDAAVDRTTDGHGVARSMSLEEIKGLRIATADGSGAEVPTLGETLAALSGRAMIAVEIKNVLGDPDFDLDQALVEATHRALEREAFVGPVLIASFNPASIARSREIAPEVPTALLTIEGFDPRAGLAAALSSAHPWLLPVATEVFSAGSTFLAEAHAAGVRIGAWTVDEPQSAVELMRWGVDAVVTNDAGAIVRARREAFGLA